MTREDYCSYEVSKLLKEKGFDEYCNSFYILLDNGDYRYTMSNFPYKNSCKYNVSSFARPTHQMAIKWLREEHKIFIEVSVCIDTNGDYHYHSMALDKICEYILPSIGTYDTYEEAIEAAIKYVLEKFEEL